MICDLSSNISDFFNVNNVFFCLTIIFLESNQVVTTPSKKQKTSSVSSTSGQNTTTPTSTVKKIVPPDFKVWFVYFYFLFFFSKSPSKYILINTTFISRDMFWIKELKITRLMIFWPNKLFFIYLKAFKILVYVSLGSM